MENMQYLRNGMTDFDKIWQGDASRLSRLRRPIKFRDFDAILMTAAILKIEKNHDISQVHLYRFQQNLVC